MTFYPIKVLMVEDDPGDVELMREALKDAKLSVQVDVVEDGVLAMEYLNARSKADLPDVIFLDLNLPRKDGRQVLSDVKKSEKLREIPIVVLTTSKADEDIHMSYGLGANCYITKPVDFEQFEKVVRSIGEFWFTVVRLPLYKAS